MEKTAMKRYFPMRSPRAYFVIGIRFSTDILPYTQAEVGEFVVLLLIWLFTTIMTAIYCPRTPHASRLFTVGAVGGETDADDEVGHGGGGGEEETARHSFTVEHEKEGEIDERRTGCGA